ncbi:hypothetical protein LNP25_22245 [Klebsiella variicola subsp. variicola]|nr:hypothetical protein [Klebsiella variicola subsp. variicola]
MNIISDYRGVIRGIKKFLLARNFPAGGTGQNAACLRRYFGYRQFYALHLTIERRKIGQNKKLASLIARCVSSQEKASTKGLHAVITRMADTSINSLYIAIIVK